MGLCGGHFWAVSSAGAARSLLPHVERKTPLLTSLFWSLSFSLRNVLTLLLFIARAFISGGFQAAYVYTPEVGRLSGRQVGCREGRSLPVEQGMSVVPRPGQSASDCPLLCLGKLVFCVNIPGVQS